MSKENFKEIFGEINLCPSRIRRSIRFGKESFRLLVKEKRIDVDVVVGVVKTYPNVTKVGYSQR